MLGGLDDDRPFPYPVRVYRLMRAGVPLSAIIGRDELPAALGDWLIAIDGIYREHEAEQLAKMAGTE